MSTLLALKRVANKVCKSYGHDIRWTPPYHGELYSIQNGRCTKCGNEVQVNTRLQFDEIGMGGPAFNVNCIGGKDVDLRQP